MKKMILSTVFMMGLAGSIPSFATTAQFNCPFPSKVFNSNATMLYSPYDPASGMPANLSGDPEQIGVNSGWIGMINGSSFSEVYDDKTIFISVFALPDPNVVTCQYQITGKTKSGDEIAVVTMQPANTNYLDLYSYSLDGGSTYNISTKIIATSK